MPRRASAQRAGRPAADHAGTRARRRSTSSRLPSKPRIAIAPPAVAACAQVRPPGCAGLQRARMLAPPRACACASDMRVSASSDSRATSGAACSLGKRPQRRRRRRGSPRRTRPRNTLFAAPRAPAGPARRSPPACPRSRSAARAGPAPPRSPAAPAAPISPAGAISRSPSTISSNRPYPLDACPADRVAAQPPSETYSNDCGKCPASGRAPPGAAPARGRGFRPGR